MIRSMICWWFVGLGVALTSPIASASAEDGPAAELVALGARCFAGCRRRDRSASI